MSSQSNNYSLPVLIGLNHCSYIID